MSDGQNQRKAKAHAKRRDIRGLMFATALAIGAGLVAQYARADSHGATISSHGYSTFGDLKYGADMAHLDYVNPEAPKGGEISIWTRGTFDHMNPYATQDGSPGAMASVAYERLFTATADEVGTSYCYLCTTIEYPEDRAWVIMNLRHDVTFSDGSPMTAADVVFTHNLFVEQGTPSYAAAVSEMIPLVEAIDDYTVKFTFGEGFSPNDTISQAGATSVQSKAWYEANDNPRLDEGRFEVSPGTGPYMIESYDINRQIIVGRNPNFWGAEHPLNVGQNNFDTIRIEYFADTTAAFEAFKAGEFNFRRENSSLSWATGYDFPALNDGWVVRETLENGNLPAATGFVFNMKTGKFADIRVRQAIALMYNFTWTNETLQYGLFSQRESFWQGINFEATGVPEGAELELLQSVADMIDPSILTDEVTVPHTSSSRQLDRGNLRLALALMEDAGWTIGDSGFLEKDGKIFTFEFLETRQSFERIVVPYIENLKRLGIDAKFELVDAAQYTELTRDFDFDMIFGYWVNGLEEGESLGQRYGASGVGDVFNPAHYENPAIDALIPAVSDATSYEEMAIGVRAIDRIMRHDQFIIPVWYLADYWVAHYDMFEHPETLPPFALGEMSFWWFNQEKYEALQAAGAFQ